MCFFKDFRIFQTLVFLCFPLVLVCIHTYQAGRTPALKPNWKSSEKSQNFQEKNTTSNEHSVSLELLIIKSNQMGWNSFHIVIIASYSSISTSSDFCLNPTQLNSKFTCFWIDFEETFCPVVKLYLLASSEEMFSYLMF